MKPTVLIDCDGVKADWCTAALQVVNRVTGLALTPAEVTTLDLFKVVPPAHKEACYAEMDQAGFCLSIDPYPGAVEGVRRLREIAEVIVVTSPTWSSSFWMAERVQWLHRHFQIPYRSIIFASEKWRVRGDILIEDNQLHVASWLAANQRGRALLVDRPYNRKPEELDIFVGTRWTRVHTWEGIIEYVKQHGR